MAKMCWEKLGEHCVATQGQLLNQQSNKAGRQMPVEHAQIAFASRVSFVAVFSTSLCLP